MQVTKLFASLMKNPSFKRQSHVWATTVIDLLSRLSITNITSADEALKYSMYSILDNLSAKQRKIVFSLLDLPSRDFFNELQRSYALDYKFTGKG